MVSFWHQVACVSIVSIVGIVSVVLGTMVLFGRDLGFMERYSAIHLYFFPTLYLWYIYEMND